jgi:hypothetical protein
MKNVQSVWKLRAWKNRWYDNDWNNFLEFDGFLGFRMLKCELNLNEQEVYCKVDIPWW